MVARLVTATLAVVLVAPMVPAAQEHSAAAGLAFELRQLHDLGSLPRLRPGTTVGQESSYDRTGANPGDPGTWQ